MINTTVGLELHPEKTRRRWRTGGEFLIAIDPSCTRVRGGNGLAYAETLFERILAQPGTRLPSDRRFATRARTANNRVSVAKILFDELQGLLAGLD